MSARGLGTAAGCTTRGIPGSVGWSVGADAAGVAGPATGLAAEPAAGALAGSGTCEASGVGITVTGCTSSVSTASVAGSSGTKSSCCTAGRGSAGCGARPAAGCCGAGCRAERSAVDLGTTRVEGASFVLSSCARLRACLPCWARFRKSGILPDMVLPSREYSLAQCTSSRGGSMRRCVMTCGRWHDRGRPLLFAQGVVHQVPLYCPTSPLKPTDVRTRQLSPCLFVHERAVGNLQARHRCP